MWSKSLERVNFHPVVQLPDEWKVFDFTKGYDAREVRENVWGIGRYNEKRHNMYTAPQYRNRRNIHMGIDIWAPAGTPVHSAWDAEVVYMAEHSEEGNYGPTIVLKHLIGDQEFYALHGHLTAGSLKLNKAGDFLSRGEVFAALGTKEENGNWEPHLHYQLSLKDPGEADMPGVVAEEDLESALQSYPDPRIVLGPLYE